MLKPNSSNSPDYFKNLLTNKTILVTASQCNRVIQILEEDRQHNFAAYYQLNTLQQSIVHRFWLTDSATVEDYLELLEDSAEEREQLYNLLFPMQRQFFFTPESWETMAVNVIPRLLVRVRRETELRCWVVSCGTGEEVYTLAMLLDEAISSIASLSKVKIFASDISITALNIASRGIYPQSITKDIAPERLEKYFTRQNDTYVVKHRLRNMIRFAPHNVLKDIRFSNISLVCCRNTLIYLRPQYRRRVLLKLHDSLRPQGILFLGDEDVLLESNPEFVPLQGSGNLFQKQEIEYNSERENHPAAIIGFSSNPTMLRSNFSQEIFKFLLGGYPGTCLLLNHRYKIIYVYYSNAELIQLPLAAFNVDLLDFISPPLKEILFWALERATKEHTCIRYHNLIVTHGDRAFYCDLNIGLVTYSSVLQDAFVVTYIEKSSAIPTTVYSPPQDRSLALAIAKLRDLETEIEREYTNLQHLDRELKSQKFSPEQVERELIAVNKNTNTINQELYLINKTCQLQVNQLEELNKDIEILLGCIDIGVIFLDRQLNIRKYNPSAQKIINFKPSDIGRPFKDLKHHLDCANLVQIIEEFLQDKKTVKLEVQNLRTKEFLLLKLHPYGIEPQSREGVILTFVDISDRKQAEKALKYQAFYDSLTGLPNRLLFKEQLQHAVTRLPRQDSRFLAVLYLDLNSFKEVNDSLGHGAGDVLLTEVARRLNEIMRSNDIVCRLGGDEFAILLEEISRSEQSLEIASRIHQILSQPFIIEHHRVTISTSIGIAFYSTEDKLNGNIEALMENADMAMYRAKQRGAAKTEIFLPHMRAKAEATMEMKNQIRQALGRDEFLLQYQPIFNLDDGKFTGFEALLRWKHPELGLIYPDQFLPIMQNSPLFFQLECSMIKQACDRLQYWLREFQLGKSFSLSVNVSPQLIANIDFLNYFQEIIDRAQEITQHLTIELTETALIDNPKKVERILEQLQVRGIKIALDDFGTGFSSLSHLHCFPLDIIKIDRSFIMSLNNHERSSHIVRSIVYLSQQLNLDTAAEGIENIDQLSWLQKHGCHLGQGYFWHPPLSATAATELLASQSE